MSLGGDVSKNVNPAQMAKLNQQVSLNESLGLTVVEVGGVVSFIFWLCFNLILNQQNVLLGRQDDGSTGSAADGRNAGMYRCRFYHISLIFSATL